MVSVNFHLIEERTCGIASRKLGTLAQGDATFQVCCMTARSSLDRPEIPPLPHPHSCQSVDLGRTTCVRFCPSGVSFDAPGVSRTPTPYKTCGRWRNVMNVLAALLIALSGALLAVAAVVTLNAYHNELA